MSGATQEAPSPKRKPRVRGASGPRVQEGGREARKIALVVLEVLGGQRTPTEAATALGVSTTRYYMLETQALAGLVTACEPRARGPRASPTKQIERLEREVKRLEKECARRQTLLRMSQRALGLVAPTRPEADDKPNSGNRKRKRRPAARALHAAAHIEKNLGPELPEPRADDKS